MTTADQYAALEDRYDELSWLEGADPDRAIDPAEAAAAQDELTMTLAHLNACVTEGRSFDRATGEHSREYMAAFADTVTLLETLAALYPAGPRR